MTREKALAIITTLYADFNGKTCHTWFLIETAEWILANPGADPNNE